MISLVSVFARCLINSSSERRGCSESDWNLFTLCNDHRNQYIKLRNRVPYRGGVDEREQLWTANRNVLPTKLTFIRSTLSVYLGFQPRINCYLLLLLLLCGFLLTNFNTLWSAIWSLGVRIPSLTIPVILLNSNYTVGKPVIFINWEPRTNKNRRITDLLKVKKRRLKWQCCNVAVNVYAGEQLNLTRISRTEMGAYLCIATNGIPPSVSKRITVDVECKSKIFLKIFLHIIIGFLHGKILWNTEALLSERFKTLLNVIILIRI